MFRDIGTKLKPFYRRYRPKSAVDTRIIDSKISVSKEAGFIYYRIPKAANSTVFYSLYRNIVGEDVSSMDSLSMLKHSYFDKPSELTSQDMKLERDYKHFTFVRNPYNRFVSCYKDKVLGGEKRPFINKLLKRPTDADISIVDFLEFLENGGLHSNAHWAPQTSLIVKPLAEMDFIGRVENLNEDWRVLCDLLQVEWPLYEYAPHKSTPEKQSLISEQVKTLDFRDRVLSLYKDDYLLLGYEG